MDTLQHLNRIREELIEEIHHISEESFNKRPNESTWSPKEVTEHIALMDAYIARLMREGKTIEKKAFTKPIRLTTIRSLKVKAPSPVDPQKTEQSRNDILNLLYQARMEVLDMYTYFSSAQKKQLSMKHPVFGNMRVNQWFDFLGYHEKRHLKQLREVIQQLKT